MNKFKKYCPNVWVVESDDEYEKGEIVYIETKYGKEVECEIYNLVTQKEGKYFYSIVRTDDESYAERKARKYANAALRNAVKSQERWKASEEGKEFLSMGEPIKVGHHSEKRHRALLDRNWARVEKAIEYKDKASEQSSKAEYWGRKAEEITLAIPESLEYFTSELEKAEEYHKLLKDDPSKRSHSYSLTYAKNAVNELKKKVQIATELWGDEEK